MQGVRVAAGLVMAGLLAGCAVTAPPAERARPLPARVEAGTVTAPPAERARPLPAKVRASDGQNDLERGNRRERSRREYIVQRIERRLRELRNGRASVVRRVPDRAAVASRVNALFRAVGIDGERTDRALAATGGGERGTGPGAGVKAGARSPPASPAPRAAATVRPPPASPPVPAVEVRRGVPVTGAVVVVPRPPASKTGRDVTPAANTGTASFVTTSIATGSIVPRLAAAGPVPPAAGGDREPDPVLARTVITGSLLEDLPARDPPGAGGTATGPGMGDTMKTRGAHLASYPDRVSAMRGWRILLERHPADLGLHIPMLVDVKAGTGTSVWLVTALGEADDVLRALCRGIRQGGGYCAPVDVERPEIAVNRPVPAG